MRFARLTAAVIVAPLAMLLTVAMPNSASAQVSTGNKLAIASPVRIFNELKETKDLQAAMQQDARNADNESNARKAKFNDLKARRDVYNPNSPQYREADQKLLEESVNFDTWSKVRVMGLANQQKLKIAYLYDKILQGIAKVAAQKKIDLVLAEVVPQLPDDMSQVSVDQLRAILGTRNILYGSTTADITTEVITSMDADYVAAGGAGAAPGAGAAGVGTGTATGATGAGTAGTGAGTPATGAR